MKPSQDSISGDLSGETPEEELPSESDSPEGDIMEPDHMEDSVLGVAASGRFQQQPPEVPEGADHLTTWDEPADASGKWTPKYDADDEQTDADRLVEAGMDEAYRESRLAVEEEEE